MARRDRRDRSRRSRDRERAGHGGRRRQRRPARGPRPDLRRACGGSTGPTVRRWTSSSPPTKASWRSSSRRRVAKARSPSSMPTARPVWSTPASAAQVDGGLVLVQRPASVALLELATGSARWERPIDSEAQVALDGDRSFVAERRSLTAFGPAGERLWQTPIAADAPVDTVTQGEGLVVVLRASGLVALSERTGCSGLGGSARRRRARHRPRRAHHPLERRRPDAAGDRRRRPVPRHAARRARLRGAGGAGGDLRRRWRSASPPTTAPRSRSCGRRCSTTTAVSSLSRPLTEACSCATGPATS